MDSLDAVHDVFHFDLSMIKKLSWAMYSYIYLIKDTGGYHSFFYLLVFIEEHLMFMGWF